LHAGFHHLEVPQKNTNDHIDKLLSILARRGYRLCVDDAKRIEGEYEVGPIIQNRDETRFERQMLEFWLVLNPKIPISVAMGDDLMTQIKRVIVERKESLDRIFVYVAIHGNTRMVTNDGQHIIDRRRDLRKLAKRRSAHDVDFLTSEQASDGLADWPS
jgi:hypothetical protein